MRYIGVRNKYIMSLMNSINKITISHTEFELYQIAIMFILLFYQRNYERFLNIILFYNIQKRYLVIISLPTIW